MTQRALFIPTPPQLSDYVGVPFDAVIGLTDAQFAARERAERAGAARVQGIGEFSEVLEPGMVRRKCEWRELGYAE